MHFFLHNINKIYILTEYSLTIFFFLKIF